jgi:hypothetical protein
MTQYVTLTVMLVVVVAIAAVAVVMLRKHVIRLIEILREFRSGVAAAAENRALLILATQQLGQRSFPQIETNTSVFADGQWERIAGAGKGWPADTYYKVRGLAAFGGDVYASLTGPRQDGPLGEVWRFSQNKWSCIAGGAVGPWKEPSSVDHLFSSKGNLFAAEKHCVWRMKGESWAALRDGLELDHKSGPYCFADWKGSVVLGQWGNPRVAVLSEDDRWSYLPLPQGGWGVHARTIYCMVEWRGHLYVGTGTGKLYGPGAAIWRYDGEHWEKIAGGGLRGSWAQTGIPFVLALATFEDRLIATVSRPADTASGASNVWAFDGDRWGAVAIGASPQLMSESLIMNDVVTYGGRLIVATGHADRRAAQVWELGAGETWRPVGPSELSKPGQGEGGWWVYRLFVDGPYLYIATAGHHGAAGVFRFAPSRGS